ncbi:hypothetical protein L596_014138 [Steinernema carpocapsae]|uniref:Uncharacterized protein n=1 Tax=Steinernema carpocapsae TaxID=34508 RepID=A0A4U5NB45_STECR|nr:hypothetical protein L596_014138 [Steinernema carpocapsae]
MLTENRTFGACIHILDPLKVTPLPRISALSFHLLELLQVCFRPRADLRPTEIWDQRPRQSSFVRGLGRSSAALLRLRRAIRRTRRSRRGGESTARGWRSPHSSSPWLSPPTGWLPPLCCCCLPDSKPPSPASSSMFFCRRRVSSVADPLSCCSFA